MAALLLLTLLFWSRFLFGGLVFYARDFGFFFAPLRQALAQAIREGAAPVWNPFLGAGIPMAGDPNSAAFFPPSLLFLLRPFSLAVRWTCALWIFALPLGAYAGLRGLKVSPFSAAAAAFALSICGPAMALATFPHVAWAWTLLLPLVARARPGAGARGRGIPAAGIAFGVAVLVGEPGVAIQLIFAVGVCAILGSGLRGLRDAGAVAGLGALVAAPQVVGALELLPQTARGAGLPLKYGPAFYSVRPARLAAFLWPGLFGDVNSASSAGWWGARFFDAGAPYISSLAVGAVTLALLPAAWRDRTGRRFVVLAALAAFISFGRFLPGGLAVLGLPGFSLLRYPEKWLFLSAFSMIAASAFALDRLRRGEPEAQRAALWGSAAILAVSVFAGAGIRVFPAAAESLLRSLRILPEASALDARPALQAIGSEIGQTALFALAALLGLMLLRKQTRRHWLVPALALLVALDLFPRSWNWTSLAPPSYFDREPAEVAAVRARGGRLYYGEETEVAADPLRPMLPVVWGVSYAGNNDIDRFSPRRSFFFGLDLGRLSFADPRKTRLLALADVRSVSTTDPTAPAAPGLSPFFRTSGVRRVFSLAGGERFRPVFRSVAAPGESEARALLLAPGFDPRTAAILEGSEAPRLSGDGEARVIPVGRRGDAETVEVETSAPALLVRAETWEPRWRATVDGREAGIFPADYAFQGVYVPAGRHRVAFRYVDRWMMLGMCVSLAALGACVLTLAARR